MVHDTRDILLRLLVIGMILHPVRALAGSDPYVKASVSASGVRDDNLFSTATGKEKDFISRLTPRLEAGVRSEPLTALAGYTFDAESFADHPELDNSRTRERAMFDLKTAPERAWSLALDASLARTQTPGELNTATGELAGRAHAQRLDLGSSLTRRFSPSMSVTSGLALVRDKVAGGVGIDTWSGRLAFERSVSPRDRLSAGYEARRFDFDAGRSIVVHAVTLGWSREASERTDVTLLAGPRLVEGSLAPEVSASIRRRLKKGGLSCTYTNGLTTNIGQAGVASYESLAAAAELRPLRSLSLSAAPSAVRFRGDHGGPSEARLYLGTLGATWQISPWIALAGSYQFTLQHPAPEVADDPITRHILLFSLVASAPPSGVEARAR